MDDELSKVLLTGATGFIGRPLYENLVSSGHQVSVITRRSAPATGLQADFRERKKISEYLSRESFDTAILLGWQGLPNYDAKICQFNYECQVGLIEDLLERQCRRIILAGTCWQYGEVSGAVKETQHPCNPASMGATKNSILEFALRKAQQTETEIVEGRVFYVYGPYQRSTSLVPQVLQFLRSGMPLELKTPYDAVDFMHVDDVAEAFACLVRAPTAAGSYNLSSGKSVQVAELVNLIARIYGRGPLCAPASTKHNWWGDNQKIVKLGFNQRYELEQGLTAMLSFGR